MLFFKECKKICFSLTFLVYLVAVIAIYSTQFGTELEAPLTEPSITDEYYGLVKTEDENIIMNSAVYALLYDYEMNTYTCYPFGFYKEVKLNQSEMEEMKRVIGKLTESDNVTIKSTLTYEEFLNCMEEADEILGGGSNYSLKGIENNFAKIPMSYEEAMEEYENIVEGRELSKSYTRLFCDYVGIILGIMPIFVCTELWQADKKNGVEPLLFSRKIASAKLVGIRYMALLSAMLLPVFITFIYTIIRVVSLYGAEKTAFGESLGLMLLWLVPEIMILISVGTIVAILWSAFGAILIQAIWWLMNVLVKMQLSGNITKWDLVVRHNTLAEVELFYTQWDNFVWNRVFYSVLSVVLLGIAIILYDNKRKGKLNGKRVLRKNHTSKSKT